MVIDNTDWGGRPPAGPGMTVTVPLGRTDGENGDHLRATLALAKTLTPGGNSRSASNRVTVLLPPARYKVTEPLVLDADFVDLVASQPAMAPMRLSAWQDHLDSDNGEAYKFPPPTLVYGDISGTHASKPAVILVEGASDYRLVGFGVENCSDCTAQPVPNDEIAYGLLVNQAGTSKAVYDRMWFWCRKPSMGQNPGQARSGCHGMESLDGTWLNCIGNAFAFRVDLNKKLSGYWENVVGGAFSFVGDAGGAELDATMVRCRARGTYRYDGSATFGDGFASFVGCTSSTTATITGTLIECEAGDNSFQFTGTTSGKFYRCKGGKACFGGSGASYAGTFQGKAFGCEAGEDSFGSGHASAKLDGEIVRCRILGLTSPIHAYGNARVIDCDVQQTADDENAIVVHENYVKVIRSRVQVVQDGQGWPIDGDGTTRYILAAHNEFNNAENAPGGLGSTAYNQAGSPQNISVGVDVI